MNAPALHLRPPSIVTSSNDFALAAELTVPESPFYAAIVRTAHTERLYEALTRLLPNLVADMALLADLNLSESICCGDLMREARRILLEWVDVSAPFHGDDTLTDGRVFNSTAQRFPSPFDIHDAKVAILPTRPTTQFIVDFVGEGEGATTIAYYAEKQFPPGYELHSLPPGAALVMQAKPSAETPERATGLIHRAAPSKIGRVTAGTLSKLRVGRKNMLPAFIVRPVAFSQ